MKKYFLLLLSVLCVGLSSFAQQPASRAALKEYARKPLWISMMDDTTANYFVVQKAFDTYFAHHELPGGEDEEMNEHRERAKIPSKRAQRRISKENRLRMDVKRYYHWREDMLPYVQDDGRILTPSERLAIWKAQSGSNK